MFYKLLKRYIQFILLFYCKKISIHNKAALNTKGPLLLVANHPNSFFDAIVIGALFKKPVHFLARGDAFTKPFHRKLLKMVNAIPVYRLSEGKENLHLNNNAFSVVNQLWEQNAIVLIFIEGICKLTHELQPFKKGAARMLYTACENNLNVQALPVGLGYSSFNKTPFSINLHLGDLWINNDDSTQKGLPNFASAFNSQMFNSLKPLIEIPNQVESSNWFKQLLFILHFPLIKILGFIAFKLTKGTVFYHSVLFALWIVCIPIYWLLIFCLLALVV